MVDAQGAEQLKGQAGIQVIQSPSAWLTGVTLAVEIGGPAALVALARRLASPYAATGRDAIGHVRRVVLGGPDPLEDAERESPAWPAPVPPPSP